LDEDIILDSIQNWLIFYLNPTIYYY
jgi:hypothetical protein